MSDCASLLLRLDLQGVKGLELSDRWREIGNAYKDVDISGNFYYDGMNLVRR